MAMGPHQYLYAVSHIRSARHRCDRISANLERETDTTVDKESIRDIMGDWSDEDVEAVIEDTHLSVYLDIALVDCQICVETATKSLFPLLGMQYPQSHAIDFEDAKDLIRRVRNEDDFNFEFEQRIPRAIFFTQLWSTFYTLAKYGVQDTLLSTSDIFRLDDANYALKHADYCVTLAEDVRDHAVDLYTEEHGHHPADAAIQY